MAYHIKYRYGLDFSVEQIYNRFIDSSSQYSKLFRQWRASGWQKALKPVLVFLKGDAHILQNIKVRRYGEHMSRLFRQYHKEGRLVGGQCNGIPYQIKAPISPTIER